MTLDPNSLDADNITLTREQSSTEPANSNHPAINFLNELGIRTESFPNVRFLVEANEKNIRVGRMVLPIRFPQHPGFVYDSVVRIARVLEVPQSAAKAHRKFFEIEWAISEIPVIDSITHPAMSFLAAEAECASCKEIFLPDPEFLNETTVRLSCPNCLNYWTISVTAAIQPNEGPELLFDLFQRDPRRVKTYIDKWAQMSPAANDKIFYSFFPYQFDSWTDTSSLDWLFGEGRGWSAISNGGAHDFETLFKGFLNRLAFEHFKNHFAQMAASSQLDQTEIQRKTDVQRKEEAHRQLIEDIVPGERDSSRQEEVTPTNQMRSARARAQMAWTAPDTGVRQVQLPTARKSNGVAGFIFGAAAVVAIGISTLVYLEAPSREKKEAAIKISEEQLTKVEAPTENIKVAEAPPPSPSVPSIPAPVEVKTVAKEEIPETKVVVNASKKIEKATSRSNQKTAEAELKASAEQKRVRDLAVEANFRQGMLHLKLQQSKEAIREFKKVVAMDPSHAEAQRGLGLAYVYEQNFEDAIASLSKYLKLSEGASDRDSVEELIATLKERATNQ